MTIQKPVSNEYEVKDLNSDAKQIVEFFNSVMFICAVTGGKVEGRSLSVTEISEMLSEDLKKAAGPIERIATLITR